METQSLSQTTRLIRRNCIYHYRRRVPDDLVAAIGRHEIHHSLGITSLTEAKKLRTIEDHKWDARFQAAGGKATEPPAPQKPDEPISRHEALRLGDTFMDIRDRALLLVGFFGALRRSGIVALDLSDICATDIGIRRSSCSQDNATASSSLGRYSSRGYRSKSPWKISLLASNWHGSRSGNEPT